MIQVLTKALAVLSLFDLIRPEWTIEEIAEETGLPRMTAYRLVKTLEEASYLVCNSGKRYHLGPALLAATSVCEARTSGLVRLARPHLEDLAAKTGETVTLALEVDGRPVEMDEVLTSRPFTRPHAIGRIFGYNNTAHGKVLLAGKSPAEQMNIGFELTTQHSINDPEALSAQLAQVRQQGVAYNYEERDIGVCSVAAPVRDQAGRVVASMAILAPPGRFGPKEREAFGEALKETAARLSAFLGYLESGPERSVSGRQQA